VSVILCVINVLSLTIPHPHEGALPFLGFKKKKKTCQTELKGMSKKKYTWKTEWGKE
jgi:hypothetical protein